MPHTTTWEPRGVVKHFWGYVTGSEFADSVDEIACDPRFDDLRFSINNFLDIEGHSIDERAIERIAVTRIGSIRSNPNIRVIVITTDETVAQFKPLIEAPRFGRTYDTIVFDCMTHARQWLAEQPAQQITAERFRMR